MRIGDAAVAGFADIQLPSRDVIIGTIEGSDHLTTEPGSLRVIERRGPNVFIVTSLARLGSTPHAVGQGKRAALVGDNQRFCAWVRTETSSSSPTSTSPAFTPIQLSKRQRGGSTSVRVDISLE